RLRCRDRGDPQYARLGARGAGKAPMMLTWHTMQRPWVARAGVIVLLLCFWEAAARWWVDPMFVSPPSRVIASLPALFDTRGLPAALRVTLWELAVAFALSVAIGLAIGLAVGLQPFARNSFMPIVLLLYGTPQVPTFPLFVLFPEMGPAPKSASGVGQGFFPIFRGVAAAAKNTKPFLLTGAHARGASRWQILRYVVFPHMIPSFFAGM